MDSFSLDFGKEFRIFSDILSSRSTCYVNFRTEKKNIQSISHNLCACYEFSFRRTYVFSQSSKYLYRTFIGAFSHHRQIVFIHFKVAFFQSLLRYFKKAHMHIHAFWPTFTCNKRLLHTCHIIVQSYTINFVLHHYISNSHASFRKFSNK